MLAMAARYSAVEHAANIEADFLDWYRVYPRHVARDTALRAYRSARKRGATKDQLVKGAIDYAKAVIGKDKKYVAHPATWLNGARWLDEQETMESFSEPWPQRMDSWRKKRIWLPMWGPRPGETGCRVPKILLP